MANAAKIAKMANLISENKDTKKIKSSHTGHIKSRTRSHRSTFALKNQKFRRRRAAIMNFRPTTRGILFSVIIINTIIIIISIVCFNYFQPEHYLPLKVEELTKNYYENIFYENLITSESFDGNLGNALTKYTERGLATITLSQLILANKADRSLSRYLSDHCETNATTITLYPEQPFSRYSYHYTINYSCDYE